MLALFNGNYKLDLDYKELEKDQDEVFDDDGLELDDWYFTLPICYNFGHVPVCVRKAVGIISACSWV